MIIELDGKSKGTYTFSGTMNCEPGDYKLYVVKDLFDTDYIGTADVTVYEATGTPSIALTTMATVDNMPNVPKDNIVYRTKIKNSGDGPYIGVVKAIVWAADGDPGYIYHRNSNELMVSIEPIEKQTVLFTTSSIGGWIVLN